VNKGARRSFTTYRPSHARHQYCIPNQCNVERKYYSAWPYFFLLALPVVCALGHTAKYCRWIVAVQHNQGVTVHSARLYGTPPQPRWGLHSCSTTPRARHHNEQTTHQSFIQQHNQEKDLNKSIAVIIACQPSSYRRCSMHMAGPPCWHPTGRASHTSHGTIAPTCYISQVDRF